MNAIASYIANRYTVDSVYLYLPVQLWLRSPDGSDSMTGQSTAGSIVEWRAVLSSSLNPQPQRCRLPVLITAAIGGATHHPEVHKTPFVLYGPGHSEGKWRQSRSKIVGSVSTLVHILYVIWMYRTLHTSQPLNIFYKIVNCLQYFRPENCFCRF